LESRLTFFNFLLQIKEAQRFYKTATKLDETSILALSGIIACQIMDGQYDVAKEQLDFLKGNNQNIFRSHFIIQFLFRNSNKWHWWSWNYQSKCSK
jgi:ATP/ADP translocase